MLSLSLLAGCCGVIMLWPPPASSAQLPARPVAPLVVSMGLLVLAALAFILRSPVLLVAGSWGFWFVRGARSRQRQRSRSARLEDALIGFVDNLALQLRAGAAVGAAFLATARREKLIAGCYGDVISQVGAGVRLEIALDEHAASATSREARLVAAAFVVLLESGGPAAPALDRLSETLRANRATRSERQAQSSQAWASAAVLFVLPLLFASGVALLDGRAAHFYLRTPVGGGCLAVMLLLMTACWWWIDTIVGADR